MNLWTQVTQRLTRRPLAWSPVVVAGLLLGVAGCGKEPTKSDAPTSDAKKESAKKPEAAGKTPVSESPKKESTGGNSASGKWGTLRGKFVVDGTPPKMAVYPAGKDAAVCCAGGCAKDDSVVVDDKGGLANVVIYLRSKKSDKIAVHPDYEKDADARVEFDNKKCMFNPHVLAVRTGQTVVLKNSDTVPHNMNLSPVKNDARNVLIQPGGSVDHVFEEAETLPAPTVCNIHPWMKGYVIPRDDPYVTVSGSDGSFEIKNLPAGDTLEFQLWHEGPGYLRDVTVDGKKASRGRVKLKIEPGDNEIGTIKVPAALLKKT